MVDFCQLDAGSGAVSNSDQVWPDWAGGQIYSCYNSFSSGKFLNNSLADGSLTNSKTIASTLGVSGNANVMTRSGCMVGGNLYVNTVDNSFANLKLSKIDLSTLTETATLATTLSGVSSSGDDVHYLSFSIGGTDYIASALEFSSNNPNFEVINGTTMASLATGQYPQGDSAIWMVPGGVVGTVATFWIWTWQGYNLPYLVKVTFNTSGNVLSLTQIGIAVNYTTIDANGTTFDDFTNLMFDSSDGNVLVFSQIGDSALGRVAYLSKFDVTTALPLWNKKLTPELNFDEYGSVNNANSVINGTLAYYDALSVYHEVGTSDGTDSFSFAQQHFYFGGGDFIWDQASRLFIFLDDGNFLDSYGWAVWRPADAVSQRWSVVEDAGTLGFSWIYRDSGGSDPVYCLRQTPDGYNDLANSGLQVVKRSTADGSVITAGPVWEYADASNDLDDALPSGNAFPPSAVGARIAGVDGIGKLYFRVTNHPTSGNYECAIIEIDKTTLAVTQTKLVQSGGENHNTGSGGAFGDVTRGTKCNVLSPDGNFLVAAADLSSGSPPGVAPSGAVWQKMEIWSPTSPSHYNYFDVSALGMAVTDRVSDGALCFDSDGFLWTITQPVASGSLNPITGTSTLWKLQITDGVSPLLSVVSSYSIPDAFYTDAFFKGTFIYQAISHNPNTGKLYLWSNAQPTTFGNYTNFEMEFDTAGETFSAAIEVHAHPPNSFVHGSWNTADRYAILCETGTGSGPFKLLDFNTATQTLTQTDNETEWQTPWASSVYSGCFPFLDPASGAYYLANCSLQYAVNEGYADLMLLPVVVPTPAFSCCEDPVIIDPAVITLLAQKALRVAHLVKFDFLSGAKFLWNGNYELPAGSDIYSGLRELGAITGLDDSADMTAIQMQFKLSGVSADVLAIAIASAREEYVGQLVTVMLMFFDTAWQPVGSPIVRKAGIMDGLSINRFRDDNGSSTRILTLTAEDLWYGRGIPPAGNYTDRDQQFRSPGDMGLSFQSEVQNTVVRIPW